VFWPRIHDITTDPDDPPAFEALRSRRAGKWVSRPEYDGPHAASEQRRAYPDIRPLAVGAPRAQVFDAALRAARGMGWEIVAPDVSTGRIEAIDTTRLMRFKDDIVIRLREEGARTRVDVRSKSRLGRGDLGTNARRIRRYLAALTQIHARQHQAAAERREDAERLAE
jgi:uncharacterized protein (DUF1499 family)